MERLQGTGFYRRLLLLLVLLFWAVLGGFGWARAYEPDPNIRADAAYASMAVYSGEESGLAGEMLKLDGYTFEQTVISHMNVLFAHRIENSHPVYVIAIAGTESKAGVKADLTLGTLPFEEDKGRQVHRGFYLVGRAVAEDDHLQGILAAVKADPQARLIITGHSLGGAAAILTGMILQERKLVEPDQLQVIVFGAPLIGDKAMVDSTTELNYAAYEMDGDIIPKSLQLLHNRYEGYYPNRVKWKSEMPDLTTFYHSPIRYMDEAERRRDLAYTEPALPAERKFYVAYTSITNNSGLKPDIVSAYARGISETAYAAAPAGQAWVDYKPMTAAQALSRAAAGGFRYAVYIEVTIDPNRKSQVGNYHLKAVETIYDMNTRRAVRQDYHVITDGGYSLLPRTIAAIRKDFTDAFVTLP